MVFSENISLLLLLDVTEVWRYNVLTNNKIDTPLKQQGGSYFTQNRPRNLTHDRYFVKKQIFYSADRIFDFQGR